MICGLGRDRLEETRAGSILGLSPACCILVGELLRGERADFFSWSILNGIPKGQ